jgi:hypothetical protein
MIPKRLDSLDRKLKAGLHLQELKVSRLFGSGLLRTWRCRGFCGGKSVRFHLL